MKNHRRKRRKKRSKTSQGRAKELSSTEEDEVNPIGVEEDKQRIADEVPFAFVGADPYSFYERTSLRQATKKEDEGFETTFQEKSREEKTKREMKGQNRVSLPPLKENRPNRKQLTFHERRAVHHSILDSKQNDNTYDIKTEGRNKLAVSLSFAGIYDLDDMSLEEKPTETKMNKKLKGILKSVNNGVTETEETLDKAEATTSGVTKCEDEKITDERTKYYVIKTLTLEDELPSNQRNLFRDKLVLPRIKKTIVPTRSTQRFADECTAVTKARAQNRLSSIGERENRNVTFADSRSRRRRKERVHENSIEQVYQHRNMPWLPVLVNGRSTLS